MKKKSIWMAVISHAGSVVLAQGCSSKRKSETTIVEYLQKNEEFDGIDLSEACSWIGEKDLKYDLQVFEMEANDFKGINLQDGLLIEPPPKEKYLYRVVYAVDVYASCPLDAAQKADRVMTDPDSLAPFLEVISYNGKVTKIDLSKSN